MTTVHDALRFMNRELLDRYCAGLSAAGLEDTSNLGLRVAT
ncbi:hypothetical protein VQ042_09625 [Aurantimonas sp. A2-1-M11]